MSDELPEGWAKAPLNSLLEPGGLFDGPFGSNLKSGDYTDSGVRVVRLENVANLRFVADKETYISEAKYRDLTKHSVGAGDIIVGSFVDGAVRVCVLPELATKAIAKADCFTVRTQATVADRKFVAYQLGTNATRDALVEEIHGVTRPRITTKQLRDFRLRLAPLPEQRRIVTAVEALLRQVGQAKERLDRVSRILKKFRQAVLAAACSGDGGATDSGLNLVRLDELLAEPLANGRSVPDATIGFPVLRLTALKLGRIDLAERKIGAWSAHEAQRFLVKRGDFLVSRGNGSLSLVARGGLVEAEPDNVAYPDTMIRVRPNESLLVPEFLQLAWEAPAVRSQLEAAAHTTAGIHKVSQKDLAAIEVPVPSTSRQREIVRSVRAVFEVAASIERRVHAASAQANKLPQAILSKAFAGELVPTEADLARAEGRTYETAAELLARIGREKDRGAETGGGRPAPKSGRASKRRAG